MMRDRELCMKQLRENPSEQTLWACVVAFQNQPFRTATGLPYSYVLKNGRNGEYTRELFVDRRTKSKSITWKTVMQAFETLRQTGEDRPLIERPKALGDVRGVSYIYPIFYQIGLIDVPKKFEERMKLPDRPEGGLEEHGEGVKNA